MLLNKMTILLEQQPIIKVLYYVI